MFSKKMYCSLLDFIPKSWFDEDHRCDLWITSYSMCLVDKTQFQVVHTYNYEKLVIIIMYGRVQYPDISRLQPSIDHNACFRLDSAEKLEMNMTNDGPRLIVIQPYNKNEKSQNEIHARLKAGIYAALYVAVNGRNMAFNREFDYCLSLKNKKFNISCFSETLINPRAFPVPNISKNRLDFIHNVGKSIEKRSRGERRRIELSLHWFEKSIRSKGLDSFLYSWIALETLGMPDTTNIRPINECLARFYNISYQQALDSFGIGKIFSLRGKILHNGEELGIDQRLTEYMECLYSDILFASLNIKGEQKAKAILARKDFDLNNLLHLKPSTVDTNHQKNE